LITPHVQTCPGAALPLHEA